MAVPARTAPGPFEVAPEFRHEALLYSGEDEFVEEASAFIRDGLAGAAPTLVVVSARKIDLLRDRLNGDADAVRFADMDAVGHNPAWIIPAWREFVDEHLGSHVPLRGIGEPISIDRSPDALVECQRHESLLNVAFATGPGFWLLCPYDTSALPDEVVDEARRSHPHVAYARETIASESYHGLDWAAEPFDAPLSLPPEGAAKLRFRLHDLPAVRHLVRFYAAQAGLREDRTGDLVLAVNELATNSIRHGGGSGTLTVWSTGHSVVCDIIDGGRIADPLAGRVRPPAGSYRGQGLWIASQICDLAQIRSHATGSVVRLHVET
jgi:anti-sigma regulatory factor (Ser/Thr protein kinase)